MGFNEDETVKFCIVEKNKLRVAESEDCTTGSLVNVKWQDNNEYQGKIFGMSDDKKELEKLQCTLCSYQSFSEKSSSESNNTDNLVVEALQNDPAEVDDKTEVQELDSQLSAYEKERLKNIEKNNKILNDLGLLVKQNKTDSEVPKKNNKKRKEKDSPPLEQEASEDPSTKEFDQQKKKKRLQLNSSEKKDAATQKKKRNTNVEQTKLQATLGNLQRAILQGLETTPEKEIVEIESDVETVLESSSKSVEFPSVFHPRHQSTPVHVVQRNGNVSADQYQYLHSLIKDQAEKLKIMETDMGRLKAEIKTLKQGQIAETPVSVASQSVPAAAAVQIQTQNNQSEPSREDEIGFPVDKVKYLQTSMCHYVTKFEVVRYLMNQLFTQEELKTCSVWGKCIKKGKAAKPMLPAERRSILFKLLKQRFPEDLKSDQECGLAANGFLKRFPGREQ